SNLFPPTAAMITGVGSRKLRMTRNRESFADPKPQHVDVVSLTIGREGHRNHTAKRNAEVVRDRVHRLPNGSRLGIRRVGYIVRRIPLGERSKLVDMRHHT